MQRKPKDVPLNLIQILPPKDGSSPSTRYNPASGHFKIQIDAEESSRWMRWLEHVLAGVAAILSSIGAITHHSVVYGKRAITSVRTFFKVITTWFVMLLRKGGRGTVFISTKLANLFQTVGQQIQAVAKKPTLPRRPRPQPVISETRDILRTEHNTQLIDEVHALRDQLSAHRNELVQVTAQMSELKALVSSQQQVLIHLGKELEAAEKKIPPTERTTPRKAKSKSTKSTKLKKSESPESPNSPTPPHIGIETHH